MEDSGGGGGGTSGIFIEIPGNGISIEPVLSPEEQLQHIQQRQQQIQQQQHENNISLVELGKSLLAAARDGDDDEVRRLMTKGAPFTTDWLGTSPLHLAALNGQGSTCEILLRAGISRDARTKVDKTPLHFAAQQGHTEIVEILLKHGADVDAVDMLRMTPLHWAVERGNVNTVEMLLRYSAAVNVESKFDKTPLEIASDNGRPDIFEMLQNAEQFRTLAMDQAESDAATMAATQSIVMSTEHDDLVAPILDEDEKSVPAASQQEIVGSSKTLTSKESGEAMKLLEAHGITFLPEDSNPASPSLTDGQTLTLTDAGKLALGIPTSSSTKATTGLTVTNATMTSTTKRKVAPKHNTVTKIISLNSSPTTTSSSPTVSLTPTVTVTPTNKTRVIKLTPQQFAAIKSGNGATIANLIGGGEKRKITTVKQQDGSNVPRKTIKIVQIKPSIGGQNTTTTTTTSSGGTIKTVKKSVPATPDELKRQLQEAQKAAENFKANFEAELRRKEEEAKRLREQYEALYGSSAAAATNGK